MVAYNLMTVKRGGNLIPKIGRFNPEYNWNKRDLVDANLYINHI